MALVAILLAYNFMKNLDSYGVACVLMVVVVALAVYYSLHEAEKDREKMKRKLLQFQRISRPKKTFKALKLKELRAIDPFAFERYCAKLLRILGHPDAYATQEGGDGGKDVVFTDSTTGKTYYCECKRFGADNSVGRPIVQKLVGSALADGAIPYAIFTTGRFTQEALIEAKKTGVKCVGPRELLLMIEEAEEIERETLELESTELNSIN